MSSKLAQFLHDERLQSILLRLNIEDIRKSVDEIIALIFPERRQLGLQSTEDIDKTLISLKQKFDSYFEAVAVLSPNTKPKQSEKVTLFFETIPDLAKILELDAAAAFAGDPAAYSREEVILAYPGFYAVCVYRIAHEIQKLNIPLIPRLITEYAHEKTGIDIHPAAKIDKSFFIDHGTGVVIGETAIIGQNVKIYQGVTLGALSVKKKLQSIKRHPTIEDDVVIYANSTILGGETIIGKGSIIGGNTWIVETVAPGSVVSLGGH